MSQKKFIPAVSMSARTLEHLVENGHPAFILLSDDWRFLYANGLAKKMLGRSQQELAGQIIWDIYPALTGSPLYESALRAMRENIEFELESNFETAYGPVLCHFVPTPDGLLITLSENTLRIPDTDSPRSTVETYAKFFHLNPAPFVLSHMETGRIVEVNDAFLRLFEYTREEVIGRTSLDLQMFAQGEDRARAIDTIRRHGFIRDMDLRIQTRSGELRDVLLSAEQIEIGGHHVLLTVLVDVTERKQMAEALRQVNQQLQASEERFSKAFRNSPVPKVISHGSDGRFIDVNDKFIQLVGYKREELIGRTYSALDLIDQQSQTRHMEILRETGRLANVENRIRNRNGELRNVLTSTEAIDIGGELHYLNVHYDITDRQRAEEALQTQEEHYRRALQDSGLVAARIDRDLRYVWIFNPHPDFRADLAIGKRDDELILPEEAADIIHLKQEVLDTGERVRRVIAFDRSDGPHYYDMTGVPLTDETGEIVGLTTASLDITRQKRLEYELEALNVSLEELVRQRTRQVRELASELTLAEQRERRRVAQILHDELQQQLYGTQLLLRMLKRKTNEAGLEGSIDHVTEIVDGAIRTARELMIDLSPPVLKGEGLGQALRWLADEMRKRFNLHVDVQESENLPVPGEDMRVLLFQIVRELLFNTVKHAHVDRARISIRIQDSDLLVEVSDLGIGIDQEMLHSNLFQSTGLGLRSAHERLLLFDGRMTIESRPGRGTCVSLFVPLSNLHTVPYGNDDTAEKNLYRR